MPHDIGELFEEPGEMRCVWRISNFMSLTHEVDMLYTSPNFIFSDACFCFLIYPYGETAKQSEGWIGLYLWRVESGPPKTVRFSFSIRKTDGKEVILCNENEITFTEKRLNWGVSKSFQISNLINRKTDFAPLDILTLICTLKCDDHRERESSLFRRLWNLGCSFINILKASENTDIVLKLKDGVIPAHRIILESRCKVFKRMFAADMQESRTGEVIIEDGSVDAFKVFLSFAYCGNPKGLCSENVCEVYKVAHMYYLRELMTICVQVMQESLTVDTVFDIIAVARLYQEATLKERAKEYVIKHKTEVFNSEKWKILKKENPEVACEIMEYVTGY